MSNQKITPCPAQPPRKPGGFSLCRTLLMAGLLLPLSVTAGVYKWVDEQGNVHYGSERPENTAAEKMRINSGANKAPYQQDVPADETAAKKVEPKKETAEKPAEAAKPEPPKQPELSRKEKKRLCDSARQRVATIESRGRLKDTDEKGNTRHLTDKERNDRLKEARADVSKYCR